MKEITLICFNCGATTTFEDKLTHNATCGECASYLRCCFNCRFHDAVAYNECKEPQADRVKEKDKTNFCEFFEVSSAGSFKQSKRKAESMQKLNDLFRKN